MELSTPQQLILWVVGQLVVGAAIWGGIRQDLKNLHARVSEIRESLNEVHRRIDDAYTTHNNSGNSQRYRRPHQDD